MSNTNIVVANWSPTRGPYLPRRGGGFREWEADPDGGNEPEQRIADLSSLPTIYVTHTPAAAPPSAPVTIVTSPEAHYLGSGFLILNSYKSFIISTEHS